MANNWAIVIGINDYQHHPERRLKYAVNDAQKIGDFLSNQAGFGADHVIQCLGDEAHQGSSTYPTCSNLLRLLKRDLQPNRLGKIDRLWFYFSGHGVSCNGRDYLITSDCLEDEIERFALPIDEVIATLRLHQDADIVLILDACRQVLGKKSFDSSIGEQTIVSAQERGITTIFSCDYGQYSYELEGLQQGVFTYALVEGLAQYTLPNQLETYLRQRVPALNLQYRRDRVEQTPRIRTESTLKAFQPLLPDAVTSADIKFLVNRAKEGELEEDFEAAKKLWWQVINASQSNGERQEAQRAIERIDRKIAQLSGDRSTPALSQKFAFLKEQIERELGLPFFDRMIELIRHRIESLSDEQIAYYIGVIITGIEERFALRGREDFSSGKNFTFWFLSKGLAQLDLSRQQKIIGHIQKEDFEAENGTLMAIHDLIIGAGGVKGDHYYQDGSSIAPSDEGWELLERVFRSEELTAFRNSSVNENDESPALKTSPTDSEDNLCSERLGANYYAKLRDFLRTGKWKEADQETAERMYEVMGRRQERWLTLKEIENFPLIDLHTIDQLWVKYSEGKFGFSVQKKILQRYIISLDKEHLSWKKFGEEVGWKRKSFLGMMNNDWKSYKELTWNTSAPEGHLPAYAWGLWRGFWGEKGILVGASSALASKVIKAW